MMNPDPLLPRLLCLSCGQRSAILRNGVCEACRQHVPRQPLFQPINVPATNTSCVTCHEELLAWQEYVQLSCGHHFHTACTVAWFAVRREQGLSLSCPYCRNETTGVITGTMPPNFIKFGERSLKAFPAIGLGYVAGYCSTIAFCPTWADTVGAVTACISGYCYDCYTQKNQPNPYRRLHQD